MVMLIFFCFRLQIPFLGKFSPKKQNYHFELKFGTDSNLNMQNSMVMLIFFYFIPKKTLLGQIWLKNQNCHFKLKFGTSTNLNMQNSIVRLNFTVLEWKDPFWANLVQKIKIVILS